jgi:K+-sensing histidine kinase KdpD
MIKRKRPYRQIAVLIALVALTLITGIAKNVVELNATTVALLYLLVVLAASALAGTACGIVVALVSGLLVNYCFLPPFGTFYIEAPEDWVSFGVYTVTAVVASHFAATVRQRAREADELQAQLSRLSRFTDALMAVRKEDLTLEFITAEMGRAFDLSYCAIYNDLGRSGAASPVFFGVRPSQALEKGGQPPSRGRTLLDVLAEEGPDAKCLTLRDRGETVGALVISQVPLAREVAKQLAAVVALVIRQSTSARAVG